MCIRYRLFLLLSLSMFLSSCPMIVSSTEAARIKVKKAGLRKQHCAVSKKDAGREAKKEARRVAIAGPGLTPLKMEEEYLAAEFDPEDNAVLRKALGLLGIKYRFGGSNYAGIDCSAFVKKVFAFLSGPLPRTAREQYAVGRVVPAEELQKGDLLFFHTYAGFPSHVGIYAGNDTMIHASSTGGRVMISNINTPYFRSRFIGARRIEGERGLLGELAAEAELKTDPAEGSS